MELEGVSVRVQRPPHLQVGHLRVVPHGPNLSSLVVADYQQLLLNISAIAALLQSYQVWHH